MFKLSNRSLSRLETGHPDGNAVVERAIKYTAVDFGVGEVARSIEKQRQNVELGASTTMNSRHLPKMTKKCIVGEMPLIPVAHAWDLFAYVDGQARWELPLYLEIAKAMDKASTELGVPMRWGACWQLLSEIEFDNYMSHITTYIQNKKALGKKALVDGPHFELPWQDYP